MSGNIGKAANRAMGVLKALAFGLMLACGTAYASEPPAPAAAPTTQDAANRANDAYNFNISPDVGDWVFDGGIAFLIIVMAAFLSISYWDSKQKDED